MKYQLLIGDVRDKLREIAPRTVQTCITSPPYWGLRDYGTAGWEGGSEDCDHIDTSRSISSTYKTTAEHRTEKASALFGKQFRDTCGKCGAKRVDHQLGLEKTPEEYVAKMVQVFREVRRVLRDDGTLWLNLGDSYANSSNAGGRTGGKHSKSLHGKTGVGRNKTDSEVRGGNQLLMPHRVALALQADGWILRSTVIWHKRSPMPESVSGWRWVRCRRKIGRKPVANGGLSSWDMGEHSHGESGAYRGDEKSVPVWEDCPGCGKCEANDGWILRRGKWRPTTGHEYVFLFSKSKDYYADAEAVAEMAEAFLARGTGVTDGGKKGRDANAETERSNAAFKSKIGNVVETRNPRTVWTLSHEPYKEAHFATFPSELVRRCLLATTPAECCSMCGAGYAPRVVKERIPTRPGTTAIPVSDSGANRDPERHIQRTVIDGYAPTCNCQAPAAPSLVLDPFAGSGTTLQVARHYGRYPIGIELSETYAEMARKKIEAVPRCAVPKKQPKPRIGERLAMGEMQDQVKSTSQRQAERRELSSQISRHE